jgi:hypothetical protein
MAEWLDLGPCPALVEDLGAGTTAVLLPGARGGGAQPALWAAAVAAQELGWNTLAVWDEYRGTYEERDRVRWVRGRAEPALRAAEGRLVLLGKSLGSFAAEIAAERALPAVWYTPLLDQRRVVAALAAARAPVLLVGGTADPAWDGGLATTFDAELLELEDVDHGMQVAGDLARSLAALRTTAERTRSFLAGLD